MSHGLCSTWHLLSFLKYLTLRIKAHIDSVSHSLVKRRLKKEFPWSGPYSRQKLRQRYKDSSTWLSLTPEIRTGWLSVPDTIILSLGHINSCLQKAKILACSKLWRGGSRREAGKGTATRVSGRRILLGRQIKRKCNLRTSLNWPCPVPNQMLTCFSEITERGHRACNRTMRNAHLERIHPRITFQCHWIKFHHRLHINPPQNHPNMWPTKSRDPLAPAH